MRKYKVEEVFNLLGKDALNVSEVKGARESIEVEGFKVYRRSMRYATFYQKGCKCIKCGKEGTYFQLDAAREGSSDSRRHFNLYAEDGTLMTKDHILPKKWGGRDTIDNFQTMCEDCNKAKGCQYDVEIDGIVATKEEDRQVRQYVSISDAIYDTCNRNHVFSQGGKPSTIAKKAIHIALKIEEVLDTDTPAYGYYWKHERFKVKGKSYNI
jgi:hypothetical protein